MNDQRREVSFLIVIGGSTGAIEPLVQLLQSLPPDIPASILVVIHIQGRQSISLPMTLQQWSGLPTIDAIDQAILAPGHIYIAPPDQHLLVENNSLRVVMGPKEHGFRPAIDPLFRTAARSYGNRAVGVVLSGALWDGTAGLAEVKARGGVTIVQDPNSALVPSMPQCAINYGVVDHVLPIAEIAEFLVTLTQQSVP